MLGSGVGVLVGVTEGSGVGMAVGGGLVGDGSSVAKTTTGLLSAWAVRVSATSLLDAFWLKLQAMPIITMTSKLTTIAL